MKALTYQLRLLEPVLVSQAESGEENSAIGLSFVPGSAIRGALVARYLAAEDPGDFAENDEARSLFLDGTVVFLNAYPSPEKERLLPRPLSWFTEKKQAREERGTLYDWAVDDSIELEQPKPPQDAAFCDLTVPKSELELEPGMISPLDDESEAFFADTELEDAEAKFYTPAREINVHIALVKANTRTDANKVYRYEALAAGEILAGAIVASDDFDLEPLQTLLEENPDLFLGGAHTAGYGHTQVESVTLVKGWTEYEAVDTPEKLVIVTLLSDTILRGPDGQFSADMDGALARLLELSDLQAKRKYQRVGVVGGFNRKWGLPLVQTWALKAGSVFVYDANEVDANRLRALVGNGIGERRAEGFGRVAVNLHTADTVNWRQLEYKAPTTRVDLSESSRALAQRMAQRHLENLLERGLTATINKTAVSRPPQNAQLSRVRNAARQALLEGRLQPIKDHLASLKGAREQFEKARVGKVTMAQWLDTQTATPDIRQQLLAGAPIPTVAGIRVEVGSELEVKYTARLIDGVMQKAIRQNQDQEVGA